MSLVPSDTLVCVLAETRAHALTWKKFRKNVLDALRADLAVCIEVPADYDYTNPFWSNAKYRWTTPQYEDWGDAFDIAQKDIGSNENWRLMLEIRDQWLGGIKGENAQAGSAGILLYFRLFLLKCLQTENIFKKYKRIIVTRSDFVWDVAHPPLELLDPDAIWLPNGEGYGGVTDRHAVLSEANYEDYLGILRPVLVAPSLLREEMSFRSNWNLESFISHSLSRQQLKPSFFPYPAFSVRQWRGSTSWSKGKWNFRLCCFVKYDSEYREVLKLKKLMSEGITWSDIITFSAIEPNGEWALNAFLANASHQKIRLNGHIIGLTFHRKDGMLAVASSSICPIWRNRDAVNVTYENGKYTIRSKRDGMYYCSDGQNVLKSKHYNESCQFELETSPHPIST